LNRSLLVFTGFPLRTLSRPESFLRMHPLIQDNVSLRPFNTFQVDVKARHFARFSSLDELRTLLADQVVVAGKKMILGGGSNVLFRSDFDGVILRNELRGIRLISETDTHLIVESAAGESWHQFVLYCIEKGWAGVENLSLIPGSVGAGPMQNIGAYGVEIQEVIESVQAFHIHDHVIHTFSNSECSFSYRESIFKRAEKDNWVILAVQFKLNKRPVFRVDYGAIQDELDLASPDRLTIREVSNAVIRIRQSKLPDPAVLGNAGSFFKNPVISRAHFERLKKGYPSLPAYPIDENSIKVAAGWLIEQTGWKGKRIGECGVHERQALVIVNYGHATGNEIFELSGQILSSVKERFGIDLEREVNFI